MRPGDTFNLQLPGVDATQFVKLTLDGGLPVELWDGKL